ncbi:MAG: immunity 17 family protein [Bacteroidales bacterium]
MNTAEIFVGILFIAIGCFSFLAGVFNWDWFYASVNASIFLRWFGRKGARYFYGTIGIVVIVVGILMLSGTMA